MKKIVYSFAFSCMVFTACNNATDKKADETSPADTSAPTATTTETPAPPMDSAAMMKAWEEYMTPGDMHKMMASWNGKWKAEMTMWMDPAAPPTQSVMESDNKMIYGGRYQQSMHKGSFEGMPFEGMSTMGWDNTKKKFVSTWVDNMGTGIMYLEGDWDAASKTMTLRGKCTEPGSNKEMDLRETFTVVDDNTQMMTQYQTKDGKENKVMEIKFTRK